jgi:hypothetical protein
LGEAARTLVELAVLQSPAGHDFPRFAIPGKIAVKIWKIDRFSPEISN